MMLCLSRTSMDSELGREPRGRRRVKPLRSSGDVRGYVSVAGGGAPCD